MADIEIRLNEEQWADLEQRLRNVSTNASQAAAAAINRTVATGATRIRRRIAREMQIGVTKLGKRVKPIKTNQFELRGKVRLFNFNVPIIQTAVTPVKGGTYPLAKIGTPQTLQNTPFKQTMLSGHVGFFARVGPKREMTKGRHKGEILQPVKQIFAPAPQKVWERTPGLAAEELSKLGPILQKNIESQISRFLNSTKPEKADAA